MDVYGSVRIGTELATLTKDGWRTGNPRHDRLYDELVPLSRYLRGYLPAPGEGALRELARYLGGKVESVEVARSSDKSGIDF